MRCSIYHREIGLAAQRAEKSAGPAGVSAQLAYYGTHSSPELAAQLDLACRDVRGRPVQTALLLRSWMLDHD